MRRATFSVLFYANKSKVKDGIVPVMGRITINGTQSQFSCKRSIPLSLWDAKGNCAKGRTREALDLNRDLDNIKAQIIKHYQHLSDREAQTVNYSGWLHSNEYRRNALANNITAQVIRDEKRCLFLHINDTPISQWFKEQFGLGQEQRRGIKI